MGVSWPHLPLYADAHALGETVIRLSAGRRGAGAKHAALWRARAGTGAERLTGADGGGRRAAAGGHGQEPAGALAEHRARGKGRFAVTNAVDAIFRAYSKRVPRTNCALRIKKCAPRISSGIYFLGTS